MGTLLYFGGHRHSHGGSRDHHDTDVEVEGQPAANSRTEENINLRAAFIHVLGDLVQSIGVFVAAIVIYFKVRLYSKSSIVRTHGQLSTRSAL